MEFKANEINNKINGDTDVRIRNRDGIKLHESPFKMRYYLGGEGSKVGEDYSVTIRVLRFR